jgi:hypothetical protein
MTEQKTVVEILAKLYEIAYWTETPRLLILKADGIRLEVLEPEQSEMDRYEEWYQLYGRVSCSPSHNRYLPVEAQRNNSDTYPDFVPSEKSVAILTGLISAGYQPIGIVGHDSHCSRSCSELSGFLSDIESYRIMAAWVTGYETQCKSLYARSRSFST